MAKRPLLRALCFGCAVLVGGPSWAATIEPGQGALSVNQGQGFEPVNSRVDANAGDAVMVAPGGSATVVYDDGCKVNVQAGSVTTIAPLSPCASGSYAQNNPDFDWGGVVMGVVTLGVIGGAAVAASESSKNSTTTPASP